RVRVSRRERGEHARRLGPARQHPGRARGNGRQTRQGRRQDRARDERAGSRERARLAREGGSQEGLARGEQVAGNALSCAHVYDLVVIGGGITGAGIARDAALRGLKVALFEKNDYGSGTSSKSSKLIHGGLRYLEHGEIRLVFESVSERNVQTR